MKQAKKSSKVASPLENSEQPINSTKIDDLSETLSFFDISKKKIQCAVSFVDMASGKEIGKTSSKCYWCRNLFDGMAIGCPIKYTSRTTEKAYISEISKERYVIKENITKARADIISKYTRFDFKPIEQPTSVITVHPGNHYTTDGIFCSFSCTLAYIRDNKHNPLYNNSELLLNKMYKELTGSTALLETAPHWKLLTEYGGTLSLEEFREKCGKIGYNDHGSVDMRPLAFLHEEKLNFYSIL